MNYGKTFPSFPSYQCPIYQGTGKPKSAGFLRSSKTQFFRKNPRNTKNNMKSHIKNKKNKSMN